MSVTLFNLTSESQLIYAKMVVLFGILQTQNKCRPYRISSVEAIHVRLEACA